MACVCVCGISGTWNALGQRLTDEKVINAVDTLATHNIKITSLIIDDNWQDIDYRGEGQWQQGWNNFEAEPKTFPKGLKATVAAIRSKHKNIEHVAVWHALLGYWAGLAPDGPLAKKYKTVEVVREDELERNLPIDGKMTLVGREDVGRFYNDFYAFLASCNVDGVKTDGQYMMDTWVSARARRELMHAYLDAWTLSSLRHFSIKAISCMSQTPQILFYAQLPRNRPAVLCRNSDDFIPEVAASHPWHVWANAHNALFTQHLNILPDWDMFQTVHEYSAFHATARCVSGGPIYITDVPGQHNIELISQMTGVTPRGKTVIFRPSVLGRTIDQYVGYDDDSLLKVASYHGRAVSGTPILGVFNISSRPLTDLIPLSRFSGVLPSMHYVVRAHSTGKITEPLQPGSPASLLTVSLGVRGSDIYSAFPLSAFESESRGRVYLANLGLIRKMTGCAAVLNNNFRLLENGRLFIDTTLKALGVLGTLSTWLPAQSVLHRVWLVPPELTFFFRRVHIHSPGAVRHGRLYRLHPGRAASAPYRLHQQGRRPHSRGRRRDRLEGDGPRVWVGERGRGEDLLSDGEVILTRDEKQEAKDERQATKNGRQDTKNASTVRGGRHKDTCAPSQAYLNFGRCNAVVVWVCRKYVGTRTRLSWSRLGSRKIRGSKIDQCLPPPFPTRDIFLRFPRFARPLTQFTIFKILKIFTISTVYIIAIIFTVFTTSTMSTIAIHSTISTLLATSITVTTPIIFSPPSMFLISIISINFTILTISRCSRVSQFPPFPGFPQFSQFS
jgi:hypothetical protein